MIKNTLLLLLTSISLITYAQKGIFKQGKITPSIYSERLDYSLVDNLIFIPVEIYGNSYTFLLDTGAPTTLSTKIKGDFQLKEQSEITDASKNIQIVKYVTIPELKINNLTFNNFTALYEDIELFSSLGIDGIIGSNIISKSAWNIDLANNSLVVSNQINEKVINQTFKKIKVKKTSVGTPTLTFTYFNKIKEKNIYFDSGYNDFFYLSRTKFNELNKANLIPKYIKGNGTISYSAFGISEGETYKLPLESKIKQHSFPTFISDVDDDQESNLGSLWLKYYHTILYKNHLYFKENKSASFKTDYQSIGIKTSIINNQIIVTFLWENTLAHQKGIKLKDTVISVNNKEVTTENIKNLNKLIKNLKPTEKVILEINNKGNYIELQKQALLII